MTNVKDWLESIDLGQYCDAFAENDIEFDILGELTQSDLVELGVSLGHRKRILKAIDSLGNTPNAVTDPKISQVSEPVEAQKRFLTLMFCDLADSTLIASKLDIEDMHNLNRAYQNACSSAIQKFDGYVARFMGDGLLVYFGYPAAEEDDAKRAVLAGLKIIQSVEYLNSQFSLPEGIKLSVRVGIATGSVVVERIEDGGTVENAVAGEAPNLAARLQGLAQKNNIIIGPDTYKLVQDYFEFIDIGKQKIKGYDEPLGIWQVKRDSYHDQIPESVQRKYFTPFVGRKEELSLLSSRWKRSLNNEGQVVVISGEAGIGKSRLIDALLGQIKLRQIDDKTDEKSNGNKEQHIKVLRYYCSSYHSRNPLRPYISNLIKEAEIAHNDNDRIQYSKLRSLIFDRYGFDQDFLNTIVSLIPLSIKEAQPSTSADPAQLLLNVQDQIVEFVLNLSESGPVILVIEDIHWIDPTSQQVIDQLVAKIQHHPIFIILSHRIETPVHYTLPNVTYSTLSNLTQNESAQLVSEMSIAINLDDETVRSISSKSAGIPLFLEEVTKDILESQLRSPKEIKNQNVRIPDTLQALLLAKLDKLEESKMIAQFASVIGNSFEKSILSHICEKGNEFLEAALDKLSIQQIIFNQASEESPIFRFRHALVRDASYDSILKNTRQELHLLVAEYLSRPENSGTESSKHLIAYHYEKAHKAEKALIYWLGAGENAFNAGATKEAVDLLNNAHSQIQYIEINNGFLKTVHKLHLVRGKALEASLGAISQDAHESYRNAVSIAHQIGDLMLEVDSLDYLFGITFNSGKIRGSLIPAQKMLDLGLENNHLEAKISGHQVLGMAHCILGEFSQAEFHLNAALDTNGKTVSNVNSYPSMTLDYLSYVKFFTGDFKSSESLCTRAIESARSESEYDLAAALSNSCYTQLLLGNDQQALKYSEEVIELAEQRGQYVFLSRGLLLNNLALARMNNDKAALDKVVETTNDLFDVHEEIELTYLLGMTAEIQIDRGELSSAKLSLDRALTLSDKNEELFYKPELLRLNGLLIHQISDGDSRAKAMSQFNQAKELAHVQNALGWMEKINHSYRALEAEFGK